MDKSIDAQKTLELVERLKLAGLGEYDKWEALIKKIQNGTFDKSDFDYCSNFARIYKKGTITGRSKIYHTKLSELDEKPTCKLCGEKSEFYCNMNDTYYCFTHVIGHDENEI